MLILSQSCVILSQPCSASVKRLHFSAAATPEKPTATASGAAVATSLAPSLAELTGLNTAPDLELEFFAPEFRGMDPHPFDT